MFIPALLSYEGTDVKCLNGSFQEAVDDHLELCKRIKKTPAKPFKGSFNVRMRPELHRRALRFAKEHDTNLNSVIEKALEHYLEPAAV